jgi:Flp pilus assembly protein TadG
MKSRPHNRRGQRGTAMVEFAIGLPVLLFLLFATAEVGRLISQYNTLTQAVRDGARYAASTAIGGTTGVISVTPAIQAAVANLVVTGSTAGTGSPLLPGFSTSNVSVTDAGNGYVSVSASYTYQPMVGASLPSFGLGAPINLAVTLNSAEVMPGLP